MKRFLVCVAAFVTLLPALSAAQFGYFGQNKIQYRRFDWRVLRGEHVDLYYYPEEEELGQVGMPLWWTEGLAEFFSAGEDTRDEMVLRDMTIAGRLPSLRDLAYAYGGLVYPVGGSLHHFLAQRYGEWRILELYLDIWKYASFDEALAAVYGRSIDQLSEGGHAWMRPRL